ncbi:hypothetical protein BC831DRAFT_481476 [Entophlyctis helioformis]|nr:hypothetical protein BC831DRAFT_481476 [Entophlyctis helioformis]
MPEQHKQHRHTRRQQRSALAPLALAVGALCAYVGMGAGIPSVHAQLGPIASAPTTVTAGYACDAASCKPPACQCPSRNPPNGLDPKKIPQFITLTFDDSINSVLIDQIRNYTSAYTNPNGCPLAATFFLSTQYTDFWLAQQMYGAGHEIAVHTINHIGDPPLGEITGAVAAISAFSGVPVSKITGFRTPFLRYTRKTFENLQTAKTFLYDSSMPLDYSATQTWPYTLDNGPYTSCSGGTCELPFRFPGLWEIPMYTLRNADGSENAVMDPNPVPGGTPGMPNADEIFNTYKTNFLNRYNSHRLPMGIYLHAAVSVTQPAHITGVRRFMDWIRSSGYSDVYWVSNQQLLAWMANATDVEASLKNPALDCLMPATAPGNQEVCDGVDNNGDGVIDEGLVANCYYANLAASFSTCFGCPTTVPNVSNPVPFNGAPPLRPVPATACANGGTWNPATGLCVALTRAAKPAPPAANKTGSGAGGATGGPSGNGGLSAKSSSLSSAVTAGIAILVAAIVAGYVH